MDPRRTLTAFFALVCNALFPPSEDEKRVRTLTTERLHALLAPQQHRNHIETLFRYREPDIRALLWQTKYKNDTHAAELLGTILKEVIFTPLHTPHLLIPIPLSAKRYRERGFNQVTRIATCAIEGLPSLELCEHVLVRTKHRTPQTRLSHTERRGNLDNVFKVTDPAQIKGKNVILLDDITTTGTTLTKGRRELLKAGARTVYCIALAH